MNYKDYLQQEKYSESSIESYSNTADKFINWCKKNATTPELVDYKLALQYVQHLQKKQVKKTLPTIDRKNKQRAIKMFFNKEKVNLLRPKGKCCYLAEVLITLSENLCR